MTDRLCLAGVCRHRRCGCWGQGGWNKEGEEIGEEEEEEREEERGEEEEEREEEGTITLHITEHTVIVMVEGRYVL